MKTQLMRRVTERHTCPTCGRPLDGWRVRDGWAAGLGDTVAPGTTAERRQPARDPQPSDFVTALGYAGLSFVVLALAGIIAAALTWDVVWLKRGLAAAAAVGVVVWFSLLVGHQRLLWVIETVSNIDLDGDGDVGEPRRVTVEITDKRDGQNRIDYVDLPVGDDALKRIAQLVLVQHVPFSRRPLCAAGALSQDEYNRLRGAMVTAGLLHELAGNKSELSSAGRAMLQKML